jgi:GntR family transcriptional regulator/MocR family aminotransferase
LSRFSLSPQPEDNGLVLGYGNTSESLFVPLVQRLAKLIAAEVQTAKR